MAVSRSSRSSSSSSSSSSSGTLDELISIASSDDRGIGSTRRREIESIIDRLLLEEEEEKNTKNNNADDFSVSARWKLLWTSERETLFLLETFQNSLAYQTIDEKAKTLRNAVEFSGGNAFVVESEIEILDERKVEVYVSFGWVEVFERVYAPGAAGGERVVRERIRRREIPRGEGFERRYFDRRAVLNER